MNATVKSIADIRVKPEITSIAQWEVGMVWHRIAECLVPVMQLDAVDNSLEDVRQFLMSGNMQAWHINWETIFVTQIQPFGANQQNPTKRVCAIIFCAGKNLPEWASYVDEFFSKWAKSMNCSVLRINGRREWLKAGERFGNGWHEAYAVVEKSV